MTLQRFLIIASVVFLIGIGVLYAGFNRVPFRHNVNHEKHNSLLPVAVAAAGVASSDKVQLAVETPDVLQGLSKWTKGADMG